MQWGEQKQGRDGVRSTSHSLWLCKGLCSLYQSALLCQLWATANQVIMIFSLRHPTFHQGRLRHGKETPPETPTKLSESLVLYWRLAFYHLHMKYYVFSKNARWMARPSRFWEVHAHIKVWCFFQLCLGTAAWWCSSVVAVTLRNCL